MVINGVGIPARIIPPYFADKVGQLNMFVPSLAFLAIVGYSWLAVHNIAGLYAWTAMFGIVSASFQCLLPSTVAALTPDLNMVGTRLGMAFSTLSFAALTGPPIGGALQTVMDGSYTGATIWAATSTLVSFGLTAAARWARAGTQWKKC